MIPASPMGQQDMCCGIPCGELGEGGVWWREWGASPPLPQTAGLLCLPQAPLHTHRQTHKPLAHTLLHTHAPTPHQGSPLPTPATPVAALAATPPRGHARGVPTGSPDPQLPPKPPSEAAGVSW